MDAGHTPTNTKQRQKPIAKAPPHGSVMMRAKSCYQFHFFVILALLLFACVESQQQSSNAAEDEEYIDLVDLSDEDLEEICTSRGFDLVREEGRVYTHQDYVDAASECLQIEAELEEILVKNPQILEDVKRESERMKNERDKLQSHLDEMQTTDTATDSISDVNETLVDSAVEQQNDQVDADDEEENEPQIDTDMDTVVPDDNVDDIIEESNVEQPYTNETVNKTNIDAIDEKKVEPIFNFREIHMEVMQQIKADITKVKNFLIPEKLQQQLTPILEKHVVPTVQRVVEHLKPSIVTLTTVAKDMMLNVVDLVKRYAAAFNNSNGGRDEEQSQSQATEPAAKS